MLNFLPGKKTYIVAAAMMVVGVVNMLTGDATGWAIIADNFQIIGEGLGFMAVRKGIG